MVIFMGLLSNINIIAKYERKTYIFLLVYTLQSGSKNRDMYTMEVEIERWRRKLCFSNLCLAMAQVKTDIKTQLYKDFCDILPNH